MQNLRRAMRQTQSPCTLYTPVRNDEVLAAYVWNFRV